MKKSLLLIVLCGVACVAAGALLQPTGYAVRVLCLVLMAASLGQCWNIVGGLANQVSLGHAAFFGIGAYASTLLQIRWGISPWIGMPVGMLLASIAAWVIALPTMRLKGPYFALATLAFGEACHIVAVSFPQLTGGPQGVSIPFIGDSWRMLQFRGAGGYVPVLAGFFVLVCGVYQCMASGRMGYYLRAIRENEEAAEMSGVNTLRVKLIGGVVSASLTALAGSLFAQFTAFFDPDSVFSVAGISIRAALIAIVGGVGSLWGPVIGAVFVVLIEELLNAGFSNQAAGVAPFIFGVVLIVVVLARPQGLASLSLWPARPAGAAK
ncbi:branched-chain amino acid ABC transporter permease [Herbaspirillum sp. alder98]|uniref:branched-chain amino acid ABC transporter permease n=1 Tax=Herbaspirillum sp. alder98 TaxID=2913096 RepID=UPI001CD8FC3B|nr:branched-chain amino acid ABC transporter permease [Herbaspirillum sp. alder98]MCA1326062.1 branched-chain amino acid ABC transporter permease [Herbaspirillum sp. alder98]